MEDQRKELLKTFGAYAEAFNSLEPTNVDPFFHLPSMLMNSKKVAVMNKQEEVLGVFKILMDDLKRKNFKESQIIGSLQVTQLSDNQGLIAGIAKRFDKNDQEIEHFGFTYTLRKIELGWKIIAGVLHDPGTLF